MRSLRLDALDIVKQTFLSFRLQPSGDFLMLKCHGCLNFRIGDGAAWRRLNDEEIPRTTLPQYLERQTLDSNRHRSIVIGIVV